MLLFTIIIINYSNELRIQADYVAIWGDFVIDKHNIDLEDSQFLGGVINVTALSAEVS